MRNRSKKVLKRSFLLLTLLITFTFFTFPSSAISSDPAGTYLGEFDSVAAYSNGSYGDYSGVSNYVNGIYTGIKWQCVEYVRRYYLIKYSLNLHVGYMDAKEFYERASEMDLKNYPNGESIKPQVGDILVSASGTAGHIAIVKSTSDNQVCTIQQNFSNDSNDTNRCLTLTYSNGGYTVGGFSSDYPIKGWLRKSSTTLSDKTLTYLNPDPSGDPNRIYWIQNNKRYHVISDTILNTMHNAGIPNWNWPNQSNSVPNSFIAAPDFISAGSTSDDLYVRLYGGIDVYKIKNGKKGYVSYIACQQENCWADIIDLPQVYLDMFSTGGVDTVNPTVSPFSVTPSSIISGSTLTISYAVSDTGGSGLNRVELWRANDNNGSPINWMEIKRNDISGNGPVPGSFNDSPLTAGNYWYGVHVVDNAGNWNDEQNSRSGGSPGDYGPIKVIVNPYGVGGSGIDVTSPNPPAGLIVK